MVKRMLGVVTVLMLVLTTSGLSQSPAKGKEPVSSGRPLRAWIADLKAQAPQTRNAAAYEIAGLGPAAVSAVPALIVALDDPDPSVRFPVTVALGEIGPGAKAAVPKLQQMLAEEINDEIAASAKRALRRIEPSAVPTE
ncbi:MAG TPA: HEAT repeat domain-containing protein [Gemmatimonadales bacterium]|nr:HEAT repeat domain-containing protein [Gemmatimonadales bacterium]